MSRTTVPIEELQKVKGELDKYEKKYPEAFAVMADVIDTNRSIGYKNICRLIMGLTPEELAE